MWLGVHIETPLIQRKVIGTTLITCMELKSVYSLVWSPAIERWYAATPLVCYTAVFSVVTQRSSPRKECSKRTRLCWPTTPEIVGSYTTYVAYVCTLLHVVTCYFVLLGVVASVCTPLLTRTQRLPTLLSRFTLLWRRPTPLFTNVRGRKVWVTTQRTVK